MSAVATTGRSGVGTAWKLTPLLLRPRSAGDARGILSVLSVVAFATTHYLLLAVVGGLLMFLARNAHPSTEWERESSFVYILLAAFAVILLTIPLLSLGSAASRLGASRRARRLAGMRLLGATPGDVSLWATLEVLMQAGVGVVMGSVLFYATAPVWHAVSFQGRAIGYTELWPTWWSLPAVGAVVLLLALVSSLTALRQVRITPLGVARRSSTPEVHVVRVIVAIVVLVAWVGIGNAVGFLGVAVATGLTLGFLGLIMVAVNLAGPYLVKMIGLVMARGSRRPARMLAGRRLMQDPKAAWRAIGALALTSFIAGCTMLLPAFVANGSQPDQRMFADDVVTGVRLTLGIAFLITAVSTGISQASAVLERADDARTLALTGAPVTLQHQARRLEVLVPILAAVVPSVLSSLLFQLPLVGQGILAIGRGVGQLLLTLAVGIALVVAAEESCGPLQARTASERVRKAD